MERVGLIDIGTVTTRAAAMDVEDGEPLFLARESRVCDLGRGVDATGQLDPEAIAAVLAMVDEALGFFAENDVHNAGCFLTSAARDAKNVEELLEPLRQRGLAPEVIEGDVEGALTFRGAAWHYPDEPLIVADLGGGSTELTYGTWEPGAENNQPANVEWVHSFELGARRLTDRFLSKNDPPARDEVFECRAYSRVTIENHLPWVGEEVTQPERLVVTGGTATSLVAMKAELEPYDPAMVQDATLTLDDVDEQCQRLASMTESERAGIVGLQPRRAGVILGGALLLGELMRATGFTKVTVSEADGLTGGCLAVYGAAHGQPGPIGFMPEVVDPSARASQ